MQVDVDRASSVREIPHGYDSRCCCAGGFGCDVKQFRSAVVDDRAHGHGDVVQPVEAVTHRQAERLGDAIDDVTVGGEVVLADCNDGARVTAISRKTECGVNGLVHVERGVVVQRDLARRSADQRGQHVADALRHVDPVIPAADQAGGPVVVVHLGQPFQRPLRRHPQRVAVEVDHRRVGNVEPIAKRCQRIGGVQGKCIVTTDHGRKLYDLDGAIRVGTHTPGCEYPLA